MFKTMRWVLLIALLTLIAGPAYAVSFHGYSIAYENSHVGQYSGLRVDRIDEAVIQASTGCQFYFTGNAIYQSQWVALNGPQNDWVELGTGHQCADTKTYHYCGFGENGVWHNGWIGAPVDNTSHTFTLARANETIWQCLIDGDMKLSIAESRLGHDLEVGLESWAGDGTVNAYASHALNQRLAGGAWNDWAGRDARRVDTPEMCGSWASDTSWNSGENVSC